MRELDVYSIPFVGLKEGIHQFDYNITDTFFKHFDASPIQQSNVDVDLSFEKKSSLLILRFNVDGKVNTECDRCLEYIDIEVLGDFTLYVKFSEEEVERADEAEDVIYIGRNETHLSLAEHIYEYIVLSMPFQRNCSASLEEVNCDSNITKYLVDEDEVDNEEDVDQHIDPRWNALSKLKDNEDK